MLVNRERNVLFSQRDRQPPVILVALTCYILIGHEMLAKKYTVSQATHCMVCLSVYIRFISLTIERLINGIQRVDDVEDGGPRGNNLLSHSITIRVNGTRIQSH